MPRRVAVIFPDADTSAVEKFRQRWDPLADSVPAHVTLAHPFLDEREGPQLAEDIAATILDVGPFDIRFDECIATEDHDVLLLPSSGGAPVRTLHDRLHSGALRAVRRPAVFVPHVTIGRCADMTETAAALTAAEALRPALSGVASTVTVYRVEPDGSRPSEFSIPLCGSR